MTIHHVVSLLPMFAAVFLAAGACGLLLRNVVPSITSTPRWLVPVLGALPLLVLLLVR